MWRRLCAILALLTFAAPAAADDSGWNEEGFWAVGRGDAGAKGCMASIFAKDGTMLLVQIAPGHVDFVVGAKKAMRPGKAGVMNIDDQRFDFQPDYDDDRKLVFFEDEAARAVAALRSGRNVAVRVDGRELIGVTVENTGAAGALDAAVACSKGESGWWGPGVGAKRAEVADGPSTDKERIWSLAAGEGNYCVGYAMVGEDRQLDILVAGPQVGLAVEAVGDSKLPRGRRGKAETDTYAFKFEPQFDGDRHMDTAQPMDSQALFTLRRARWLRLTVDGRELVDASLEGTGFAEFLDSALACAAGEKGWWGEGAAKP